MILRRRHNGKNLSPLTKAREGNSSPSGELLNATRAPGRRTYCPAAFHAPPRPPAPRFQPTTPLPNAKPSALTTVGACFSMWAAFSKVGKCAIGCCRNAVFDHDFLSKILRPLQLRCLTWIGLKASKPSWLRSSTIPAASASSGPIRSKQ